MQHVYTKQPHACGMNVESHQRTPENLDPLVDVDLTGVDIMAVQVQMTPGFQAPGSPYPPQAPGYQNMGVQPAVPFNNYNPTSPITSYQNPYPPPTHPAGYAALPTSEAYQASPFSVESKIVHPSV